MLTSAVEPELRARVQPGPGFGGDTRGRGTPPVRPASGYGRRRRNCSSRAGRGGHVVCGLCDKERAWEQERSGAGGLAAAG